MATWWRKSIGASAKCCQTLKQNGLEQNTLVMFSSDNGPWYQGSPGKLRGRKNTTYEGGMREPFIARWPGRIPAGACATAWLRMMDIFPTVASCAAARCRQSRSTASISGRCSPARRQSIEREPLLYFDNWDSAVRALDELEAARRAAQHRAPTRRRRRAAGTATRCRKPELYNLANDPDESYDVAAENPQIVAQIQDEIAAMLKSFPEEVQKPGPSSRRARRIRARRRGVSAAGPAVNLFHDPRRHLQPGAVTHRSYRRPGQSQTAASASIRT